MDWGSFKPLLLYLKITVITIDNKTKASWALYLIKYIGVQGYSELLNQYYSSSYASSLTQAALKFSFSNSISSIQRITSLTQPISNSFPFIRFLSFPPHHLASPSLLCLEYFICWLDSLLCPPRVLKVKSSKIREPPAGCVGLMGGNYTVAQDLVLSTVFCVMIYCHLKFLICVQRV